MRIGPALLVCGALTLGACASPGDVRSTSSSAEEAGERLPPVDQPATTTSTSNPPTTVPGTRPVDFDSLVLLASDLPGWDVVHPTDAPSEQTPEALDCPDMNHAWGVPALAGTRSSGTNGVASFRNTAVEFTTGEEAADVLDAVESVWNDCTLFESTLGSFWSEPIAMPSSTLRTAGLVIGNADSSTSALAYWQVGETVVVLEVEGDEMWTHLDPLLETLSARLDGAPTPIDDISVTTIATQAPDDEEPSGSLPVIVPATPPTIELPTTTTADPQVDSFPPSDEDWTEHRLAHIALTPDEVGPGWEFEYGSSTQAEPADPDDAIDGCDAPVPPTLDGYELEYRNSESQSEVAVLVGDGTSAESQIWIDAFRALAACDLDPSDFTGPFDLVEGAIDGADDSVLIAGEVDFDADTKYVQVVGAARVDGIVVAAFVAIELTDARTADAAVTQISDMLALMLAAR